MPKKITLIFMLSILLSGISVAEEEIKGAEKKKDGDLCAALYELAENIMIRRQDGRPIAEMMAIFENEGIEKLARAIIVEAYKISKGDNDKLKAQAVDDFANRFALECYAKTL